MKRIAGRFLAVFLVLSLLTGCTVEVREEKKDSGGNQYYLYYVNKEETKIVKEDYRPEKESAEFMLKDLTGRLNSHEAETNNQPLLPAEVEIKSYELQDSLLRLDFGNGYSSMSRTREILVRAGLVRTYQQVPGVTGVVFYVGDKELLDSKGNPVGEMDNSSFVELWGNDKDAYRSDTFTLYFTDKTGKKLIPENRTVSYKRSIPKERVILDQLIKGPMVKEHYPTLPGETQVLGIVTADRVCYVDFNKIFSDYALDISEKTVIYSVVNSLLATADADKVQIMINGEDDAELGEGTSLYNFYGWNEDLILAEEPEE